jgi:hypothetical protein
MEHGEDEHAELVRAAQLNGEKNLKRELRRRADTPDAIQRRLNDDWIFNT